MLMSRLIRIISLAAMLMVTGVAAVSQKMYHSSLLGRADAAKMNEWVENTFSTLSPEEKVAQLVVLAVQPSDNAPTRKLLSHYVEDLKIGGLLFSEGECVSEANLINYAQERSQVPLMITLDGEWGLSMRLADTPVFPRNMVLGAIADDRLLYEYGKEVARECKLMGIHVNFAPVLDVNDNPKNPVIGTRSFGEMPERVASLGVAYARGLEDNGVLSTAKHFPGHGSTNSDSHKTLPQISKSRRELALCELVPFRHYAEAGLSGVMIGHLSVPALDAKGTAASLSPATGRLLRSIGFQGLAFTDALAMDGAKTSGSVAVKALLAGNDVLLMLSNVKTEIAAVLKAVDNKKISQSLIDEKCKKMLRYKYALGLSELQPVSTANLLQRIGGGHSASLIRRMWANAMTVIRNRERTFPIHHLESTKIAVVTMGDERGVNTMFQRRCAMYAHTDRFSYKAGENFRELEEKLKQGDYDKVIVGIHSAHSSYCTVMASLVNNAKEVSVAMFMEPYRVKGFTYSLKHCKGVLLAYDNNNIAQDYAAQTVFGGNGARGILPVTIEGVAKAGTSHTYKSTRLGYTLPEEVGMSSKMLMRIDSVAHIGVKQRAFSGLQVLVARHGKVVCNRSYGYTDFSKTREAVDENTLFDLASVSKATGTLAGIMKCYDQSRFSLDDKVSQFVTELKGTDKEDITFSDLLFHESGMPATLNMYYVMMNPRSYKGRLLTSRRTKNNTIRIHSRLFGNKAARLRSDIVSAQSSDDFSIQVAKGLYGSSAMIDTVMSRIYNVKLRKNKNYLYSCLNFCLLMDAEQRMTKMSHDKFVNHYVFQPLGAYNTCYRPTDRDEALHVASTENDTFLRRQILKGYVHDELAAFLGGVSGNAGLFSTANDLAKLCQMWLNRGEYGGIRFLKPQTVDVFMQTSSENSRRGLGFDRPDKNRPRVSPCCNAAPETVVGHTGFTGTCFWVDKENDMIYIFLSNRVLPTRDNRAFKTLNARKYIQSIIYQSIED